MATRDDRRAGMVLLGLAAAGLVLRLVTGPTAAPGAILFRSESGPGPSRDSVSQRAQTLARPLAPDERIDIDGAPADELVRLPRIGPALAARIVADRGERGPFGSLEALDRVPGVGPALLAAVRPHAAFSGRPRRRPRSDPGLPDKVRLNTATAEELAQLPGVGPTRAQAIVSYREKHGPFTSLAELARVRGIGEATVERVRGHVIVP